MGRGRERPLAHVSSIINVEDQERSTEDRENADLKVSGSISHSFGERVSGNEKP